MQAILRDVKLTKKGRNQYQLPGSEQKKILKALDDSVKAEKGIPFSLLDDSDEEEGNSTKPFVVIVVTSGIIFFYVCKYRNRGGR